MWSRSRSAERWSRSRSAEKWRYDLKQGAEDDTHFLGSAAECAHFWSARPPLHTWSTWSFPSSTMTSLPRWLAAPLRIFTDVLFFIHFSRACSYRKTNPGCATGSERTMFQCLYIVRPNVLSKPVAQPGFFSQIFSRRTQTQMADNRFDRHPGNNWWKPTANNRFVEFWIKLCTWFG